MKKCKNCGYVNADKEQVCTNCGEKLEEETTIENIIESGLREKIKRNTICIMVLSLICAILFFLLLAISIFTLGSENEELVNKDFEIKELESKVEAIQEEYDLYKESMNQYEDIFQYAEDIRDYGSLKSESEKLEQEKKKTEEEIIELKSEYEKLEKELESAKNPTTSSKYVLYSDDKVEIYFSEITKDGVVFEVKNMTDINLTFQADSVAINGISTNSIIMSDDVAPQSVGKIIARCSDFSGTENVYSVSGQLRVIDFSSNNWDTYQAKFTNVEIH